MTNELKIDIEMILYDLNTVKKAGEIGGNPDSFLAKSAINAIALINQQAAELEAANNQLIIVRKLLTFSPLAVEELITDLDKELEAAKKVIERLRCDPSNKVIQLMIAELPAWIDADNPTCANIVKDIYRVGVKAALKSEDK